MKFFKWANLYRPREIYKKYMGSPFSKGNSKNKCKDSKKDKKKNKNGFHKVILRSDTEVVNFIDVKLQKCLEIAAKRGLKILCTQHEKTKNYHLIFNSGFDWYAILRDGDVVLKKRFLKLGPDTLINPNIEEFKSKKFTDKQILKFCNIIESGKLFKKNILFKYKAA